MKKLLVVLVFVFVGTMSYAQWSVSGAGHIYNTTLAPAQNVGIGIIAPTQLLHLYHPTKANILCESNYSGTGALQTMGNINLKSVAYNQGFQLTFRRNAGGYNDMLQSCQLTATTYAEFQYFRYDTQKWQMRSGVKEAEFVNDGNVSFNNTGAVGIGMGTTPIPVSVLPAITKLAVGGKVYCKEVEVTLSGLPDFVFNNDYKLRSLYDVENFINLNKHLPDVPSATEVETNGMNLGNMNATLLQKVEELTLYMIDLKKENDALKARVSNLEK
jgi:hypothetical protein